MMLLPTIKTTTLNNGWTVLAGTNRFGEFGAKKFTNMAQAQRARDLAEAEGFNTAIVGLRVPIFVRILGSK